uniref:Uncharacterized protein n=1 Tax=Oryza punctata TaxID=4537 RepID=A0A0E0MI30_ORYPU
MKYYRHFLFMVISVSWRPYWISAHEALAIGETSKQSSMHPSSKNSSIHGGAAMEIRSCIHVACSGSAIAMGGNQTKLSS